MKFSAFFLVLIGSSSALAQSWYDDADGTGFAIAGGQGRGTLVSGKANAVDKSITLSVFSRIDGLTTDNLKDKDVKINSGRPPGINQPRPSLATLFRDNVTVWGWGTSIKGKSESGLGSLFSTGAFTPSATLGGYLTRTRYVQVGSLGSKVTTLRNWLLGVRYTNSSYRFADFSKPFNEQLGDPTPFNGWSFTLARNFISPFKPDNDETDIDGSWFGGLSVSVEQKNNYSTLPTAEIKTSRIVMNKVGSDTTRVATIEDENGYSYAVSTTENPYKTYWNVRLQGNIGLIPPGASVSLRLYPSVVFRESKTIYNIGLGAYFLKAGEPTISLAGVFFELNDLGNNAASKDPFLKRTFTIGLVASLNILTGEARTE